MKRVIVDSSDTVIGAKSKDEIDFSVDIYRVSALWVKNSDNELLIAQRSLNNTNGAGLWGPSVAGTVEQGESYEQNIYKEAFEEIGLDGVEFTECFKAFSDGSRKYFCTVYLGTVSKEQKFVIQEDEVNALEWVHYDALMKDARLNPEKYLATMEKRLRDIKNYL